MIVSYRSSSQNARHFTRLQALWGKKGEREKKIQTFRLHTHTETHTRQIETKFDQMTIWPLYMNIDHIRQTLNMFFIFYFSFSFDILF